MSPTKSKPLCSTRNTDAMTPTERHQSVRDQVSQMLARLEHDERMIVITNAFVFAETSPVTVLSALAQVMLSLSVALNDDGLKLRCAKALHDVANAFEETTSGKVLN